MISEFKYVSLQGAVCPTCGGFQIEASGFVEVEGSTAWQEVHCLDCGSFWIDKYQLQGYYNLTGGVRRYKRFESNGCQNQRRLFEYVEEEKYP